MKSYKGLTVLAMKVMLKPYLAEISDEKLLKNLK